MGDTVKGENTGWDEDHVAVLDPAWSITYDRATYGYLGSLEWDERHLIVTASGLISLTPLEPGYSTYSKTIHTLWVRLEPEKRTAMVNFLVQSEPPAVNQFKAVLASLLDSQFDVLVEIFNYASTSRFRAYLQLLALPKVNVHLHGKGPWEKSTNTLEPTTSLTAPPSHCLLAQSIDESPQESIESIQETLPGLIKSIQSLPRELFDMIEEATFRKALVPGHIFPDQMTDHDGMFMFQDESYEQSNAQAFFALRPALLAGYRHAYWAENVWVIGVGHPDYTTKFLDRMEDLSMQIKKLYLSFSLDDAWDGSHFLQETIKSIQADNNDPEIANLRGLERFASHYDSISTELTKIWRSKFSAICWLDLNDLTLDLRNAYDPDDVYLAKAYWLETLPPFRDGLPAKFTILARTPELVTEAREAITAIN